MSGAFCVRFSGVQQPTKSMIALNSLNCFGNASHQNWFWGMTFSFQERLACPPITKLTICRFWLWSQHRGPRPQEPPCPGSREETKAERHPIHKSPPPKFSPREREWIAGMPVSYNPITFQSSNAATRIILQKDENSGVRRALAMRPSPQSIMVVICQISMSHSSQCQLSCLPFIFQLTINEPPSACLLIMTERKYSCRWELPVRSDGLFLCRWETTTLWPGR